MAKGFKRKGFGQGLLDYIIVVVFPEHRKDKQVILSGDLQLAKHISLFKPRSS